MAMTAPLDAAYAAVPDLPSTPRTDAVLIIVPARWRSGFRVCLSICAPAYLEPRNTPRTFTLHVASNISGVVSHTGRGLEASPAMPALLTMLMYTIISRYLEWHSQRCCALTYRHVRTRPQPLVPGVEYSARPTHPSARRCFCPLALG